RRENPYPTRVLARATASAWWRHPNHHALHVLAGCDLDLGEPEHHARLGRTVDRRRPADGLQPDRPARYPTEREPAPRVGVRADPAGRSVLVLDVCPDDRDVAVGGDDHAAYRGGRDDRDPDPGLAGVHAARGVRPCLG